LRKQRGDHVVGVHRLGEIIGGAELDRVHCGRDVAVAGEHDAARLRPPALEGGDHVDPIAVAEPHVDHRKCRRCALDLAQAVRHRFRGRNVKAAAFQRLGEPLEEGAVILDDQQGTVGGKPPRAPLAVYGCVHSCIRGQVMPYPLR
jgi:hypothetical protein